MAVIIPAKRHDGRWVAFDTRDCSAYAKSIWFNDSYDTEDECSIDIHNYLEFGCTNDYSDKMRG